MSAFGDESAEVIQQQPLLHQMSLLSNTMSLTRLSSVSLLSTLKLLHTFLLSRQLRNFAPFTLPHHPILRSYATIRLDRLPPRRIIPEGEIEESFLKGSGPGGQKINKTSSAVQLKHLPSGIVVKCQATRSRAQNRKSARKLLAEKLEQVEMGDQSRTALRAELERRKRRGREKKARKKYGKKGDVGTEVDEEVEQDGGEAEIGRGNADGLATSDNTNQTAHEQPRQP